MKSSRLNIQYIRYVDDIRIFSKDKITGQKAIAYLDLLARDLGLIPQVSKILITEIHDINQVLRHQKNKFSLINKEYKKREGSLKSKTHKNLKKRFLNCFDKNSDEEYLDKTLISFSLYKLNEDNEIKLTLLENWQALYIHFESMLFYLKRYFSEDQEVKNWLINILCDENILFHHVVALILKFFPEIEFIENVYKRYMLKYNRHWLVQYFMISWLYKNKKFDFISTFDSQNYFLNRQTIKFKFEIFQDQTYKNIYINNLLKNSDSLVALHGIFLDIYLIIEIANSPESDITEYNYYVKYIASNNMDNYIQYVLKTNFDISSPDLFFNDNVWTDKYAYKELNLSFRLFFEYRSIDPSKSLLNLNGFNNLVYDKICEILKISKPAKEYGVNLDSGCIEEYLPITNKYFTEINKYRNQRTEAHPYDKHGDIRNRIKIEELEKLIDKQIKALKEICQFYF